MKNNSIVIEVNLEVEEAKKAVNSEVARLNEIREDRASARRALNSTLEQDPEYKNLADEKRTAELNLKVKRNKVIFDNPVAKNAQEKIEDLNGSYKAAKMRVSNALINYWSKSKADSLQAPSGKLIEFEKQFSIKNSQLKLFE